MAKEKKINQAEESLNEKTDISTPLSEFVRKFKKPPLWLWFSSCF